VKRTPQEIAEFIALFTPKEKIMHEMVGKVLKLNKEGRFKESDNMLYQPFSTDKYTFIPCETGDLPHDTNNITIEEYTKFKKKCFVFLGVIQRN